MKTIILAAGYATRLQPLTDQYPKPLLAVGGHTILDRLLDRLEEISGLDQAVIVSNHRFIPIFERWAQARRCRGGRLAVDLLDDGTESNETRLGAIRDLDLALDRTGRAAPVFLMAADNLPLFSLGDLVERAREYGQTTFPVFPEPDPERRKRRAVVTFDQQNRVTSFEEKPARPRGEWVCPAFYVVQPDCLGLVRRYLEEGNNPDAPGHLFAWLHRLRPLRVMPAELGSLDIGNLESYLAADRRFGGPGELHPGLSPFLDTPPTSR